MLYIRDMPIMFVKSSNKFVRISAISGDHFVRLREVQTGNHNRLEIISIIDGGELEEKSIRLTFSAYNVHGKWFKIEGRLKTYLNALPRGPEKPLPKKRGPRLGSATKMDSARCLRIQRLAARNGAKRLTLQQVADQCDVALSTIFTNFPGGRKAIIAWKPKCIAQIG